MNLNVPPKTAGEEELFEFAQAFDGYEHWGHYALQCFCEWEERFVRSGELPEGPADLRAALFLAWRACDRGGGPGPFSEHGSLTSLFYAVLERLRDIEEVLRPHTRLRDGTVLEVMTIDWPHPHEPAEVWHRFRSWKNGPTPNQLERARQQILASRKSATPATAIQKTSARAAPASGSARSTSGTYALEDNVEAHISAARTQFQRWRSFLRSRTSSGTKLFLVLESPIPSNS